MDRLKSVKYSFVVAIVVCIDVCHHVVARRGLRAPQSFADAFRDGDLEEFQRVAAAL